MKILVTGASGQLGNDMCRELQRRGMNHLGVSSKEMNITDHSAVEKVFTAYRPTVVIHCAAYSQVDLAQSQPALCHAVNVDGTRRLACFCKQFGAYMIYISTDYVFDGYLDRPYETRDLKNPLCIYGETKSIGEDIVRKENPNSAVVRTSWLFGQSFHNHGNFVESILHAAKCRNELSVVADQIGSPTYTEDLAALLCKMIEKRPIGVFHATNEGFCSRAEFARKILEYSDCPCLIEEVNSEDYPSAAMRPKNSMLSKASLDQAGLSRLPEWTDALARYLDR